jgi:hypothetical protein
VCNVKTNLNKKNFLKFTSSKRKTFLIQIFLSKILTQIKLCPISVNWTHEEKRKKVILPSPHIINTVNEKKES